MPFTWYFDDNYKPPFLSEDTEQSCQLAYEYFCMLMDDFIARLPEHRQPLEFVDWLAEDPTLADRVNLIFPNGFGEYDEEKNHNPSIWPALLELSHSVHAGTTEAFAGELCEWGATFKSSSESLGQIDHMHRIFEFLTFYLQLFVSFSNPGSLGLDFKYPPDVVRDTWTKMA